MVLYDQIITAHIHNTTVCTMRNQWKEFINTAIVKIDKVLSLCKVYTLLYCK